jgi:hypothetical protein
MAGRNDLELEKIKTGRDINSDSATGVPCLIITYNCIKKAK